MRRSITRVPALAASAAASAAALAACMGPAMADLTPTPPGAKTFTIQPAEESATLCPAGLQLKSVQALAAPSDAAVPVVLLARDRKDLPDGKIVIPYGFRFLRKAETAVRVVMICGF